MLCDLPVNEHPRYFFWSGNGDLDSEAEVFRRLFKIPNIIERSVSFGRQLFWTPYQLKEFFVGFRLIRNVR